MNEIEEAKEEDEPLILEIAINVGVFKPEEIKALGEILREYLSKGRASGYEFLVYRQNGRVMGFACFGPHPLTSGTFDLYWIAVAPEAQRKGVGKFLMAEIEKRVKAEGGRLIVVETSGIPSYFPARKFYEACGFYLKASIRDFYAPGDDLLIFAKWLLV